MYIYIYKNHVNNDNFHIIFKQMSKKIYKITIFYIHFYVSYRG